MIRLYLIEDYKGIYPDLSSGDLSGALVYDILIREGIDDPHILRTENGKPCERDEKIWFSVSHSGNLFACAVGDHEIGLDIQDRRPSDPKKLSDRFFTEEEKSFLESIGADGDVTDCSGDIGRPRQKGLMTAFLRLWTRKEALVKYRGSMLSEVIGSESVLDREDVDFIDMDIDREVIGCLCISPGEDREVEIVRYEADKD